VNLAVIRKSELLDGISVFDEYELGPWRWGLFSQPSSPASWS
jgi:hypothetical protein